MFQDSKAYSSFAVKDIAAAKAFYERLGVAGETIMGGYVLDLALPGGGPHVMVYQRTITSPRHSRC
jgi:hypothetical protein